MSDLTLIYNGNWTEWSEIWAEITRVISKSNERAALVRFEITSTISDQNCSTRGSITTLLHPFWNCPNTGLGQFKHFIDAALSRFEIWFVHLLEGGGGITVLETKVAKFATILFFFHFPAIWLFSLKSLEIWLVVLFLLWPSHWLGKRCDLKQKNGAIRESNASIRANQITGTTNDFKMGVINTI